MAKTELKTKRTKQSVASFIAAVPDLEERKDSRVILKMMQEITGEKPAMWGTSIIGFGQYHYKSERSTQEGDWPITGFSTRKDSLSLYIMSGFGDHGSLMKKLGEHKTGQGCLYIKRLSDVHMPTLKKLVAEGVRYMRRKHPNSKT